MKLDENGIGIADAGSLSSEEGERGGLAKQIERSWISKFRRNKGRQAPGRNYMATLNAVREIGDNPSREEDFSRSV